MSHPGVAAPTASRKTRILILLDHLGTGGAQVLLRDVLARHDRTRFEFYVAYLCEWRAPRYREAIEALGVPVLAVTRWRSLACLAADLSIPFRIARLVRKLSINILEVHLYLTIVPAVLAQLLVPKCRMVYVFHARRFQLPPVVFPLLRWAAPSFDLFSIGDGQHEEVRAIGVRDEKMWHTRSVGSFSDVEAWGDRSSGIAREFGIPEGAPVVLNVSRLHKSKGHDRLLRCFAEVRRRVPDAWLVLVGDGPAESRLKELATCLGIADRVVFAGFRSDLPNFFRGATVYAVASLQEGMGLATLSALMSGLPVVAFDVGNLHRVVLDGRTGALVPPGDVHRFSEAIVRLLGCSSAELKQFGQAGRALVRNVYSVHAFVSDREAYYAHLLADRDASSLG